ncbi:Methionyl-tRNA formyltransferase [Emericellopsis cladophorae]|uniref:Methionyl-tRNA formyltransferase n=1 Tax=Emericellopsis cladophorae TaxID=2686198 RepID=A0A9Q0BEX7_9HYPO|nr:Methionyl-tRNA formyltransferase [Emericellopsis cladophorae]KAI6781684.1 Methionyl-tRNA formyltransferase [Emericellopsis cladophorae]
MSPLGSSTPTPRRFLLSKRNQQQSTAGFQSTPRFQAPSSSARAASATSVQRPPSTASAVHDVRNVAPLKLAVPQGKQRGVEDVDDEDEDDERVEVSSVEQSEREEEVVVEEDAIEASSSPRSHVDEPDHAGLQDDDLDGSDLDDGHDDDGAPSDAVSEAEDGALLSSPSMERDTKRRKLSITPPPAFSPPSTQQQDEATNAFSDLNENQELSSEAESSSTPGSPSRRDAQQPTFRRVPRFKPLNLDLTTPVLPVAFSPQRRGARYLTGGLAADVQSMLSAIKSEDQKHASSSSSSCTTIRVEEVRAGRRMYLVRDGHGRRIVLAGEGKLTGLGRRAPVAQGSVVDVGQLSWSVDMEGKRWEVHCDWSMVV